MLVYNTYIYDVWGNAKDGYEVNNKFASHRVEIPGDILQSDSKITARLRKVGFIRGYKGAIRYEGDPDHVLYAENAKNGKPLFELEFVKEI